MSEWMGTQEPRTRQRGGNRTAGRRRLAVVLLSTMLAAVVATAARAQDPPPVPADPTGQGAFIDKATTDTGEACQDKVNENALNSTTQGAGCDNKYTPIAKDGGGIGWTQIAGQMHESLEDPNTYNDAVQNARAPIPPTVDFYTVSFANQSRGFAGGARCREDAPPRPKDSTTGRYTESNSAYQKRIAAHLNSCERLPVIYRYSVDGPDGPLWEEAYFDRTDKPGFVGAITWLQNLDTKEHGQRVLAVGGTGSPGEGCPKSETDPPYPDEGQPSKPPYCGGYPRREPAIPPEVAERCQSESVRQPDVNSEGTPPTPSNTIGDLNRGTAIKTYDPGEEAARCEDEWRQAHDPAGEGRAWLFSDGDWQDLGTPGDGLPRGMRGMTAADASLNTTDCPAATNECAMTGALQQLWMWKDDGFDSMPWRPDAGSDAPSKPLAGGFADSGALCRNAWECRWHFRVRAIRFSTSALTRGANAWTGGCCSNSAAGEVRTAELGYTPSNGRWSVNQIRDEACRDSTNHPELQARNCNPRHLAESVYAASGYTGSQLLSPGGPERPDEPPAQLRGGTQAPVGDLTQHWASSARLVAGDGDLQGHQTAAHERIVFYPPIGPDGTMDWAVGGFKPTSQAVAYTTTTQRYPPAGVDAPWPLDCPPDFLGGEGANLGEGANPQSAPNCKPNEKTLEQTKSGYLMRLSSYFLNGFTMAGNSGIGWGVGDRGAIERLDATSSAAGGTLRPEGTPKLGAKRPAPAPARGPYEAGKPELNTKPGTVPPIASGEEQELPEPRLIPYGSPDPNAGKVENVTQLVMSRDGSEGWAIGPAGASGATRTTLHRFDGTRWRGCNPDSVEGVFRADPSCEALWPFRHSSRAAPLRAIARIPMEFGSDPTKADDFEAMATGRLDDATVLLRYRDGRWAVDEPGTKELKLDVQGKCCVAVGEVNEVAFSAPDEGWLVANRRPGGGDIYRFDGQGWTRCAHSVDHGSGTGEIDKDNCADHNQVLFEGRLTSAGDRVYLYGTRVDAEAGAYPAILYKDPGPCTKAGDPGCWQKAYDPGCVRRELAPQRTNPNYMKCVGDSDQSKRGNLDHLSVALASDGSYNGWGLGWFGADTVVRTEAGARETPLIHLTEEGKRDGKQWEPAKVGDAARDYLLPAKFTQDPTYSNLQGPKGNIGSVRSQVVALPGPSGNGAVFATPNTDSYGVGPTVWFNPVSAAWRVLRTPYEQIWGVHNVNHGNVQAMAPDNTGGLWFVAGAGAFGAGESIYYRFSDRAPRELLVEAPHPIREEITAAAGGDDGSFWVATATETLYRYDRQTGWDRINIPGWDPGRVRTVSSPAHAIAVGPDSRGVVVGRHGRIANIGPGGVGLDAAAGILCFDNERKRINPPPCGSGRDLRAAAVAPDGSAMVGGDSRALLYRSGQTGAFDAITPPPTAVFTTLTGISMPRSDQAWITTDSGQIWGGTLDGEDWRWKREDTDEFGGSIARDVNRNPATLRAIAINASGHGYAVGARGTIIERTGDDKLPWKRIDAGYLDEFRSVALGPDGEGVLIGGDAGLVLTLADGRFEPVRVAHRFDPTSNGFTSPVSRVKGLALLPGYKDGQIEAWAATQVPACCNNRNPAPGAVFHYASDSSEPLLDGQAQRAEHLPDSPKPADDALSFAAFGNSGCQVLGSADRLACAELLGSNTANNRTATRIRDELLEGVGDPGSPDFSLFTGDVGQAAGTRGLRSATGGAFIRHPLDEESRIHERWAELIADPLNLAGAPVFAAIGGRDLSDAQVCDPPSQSVCRFSGHDSRTGGNFAWRQALVGMPAPWGAQGAEQAKSSQGLTFDPIDTGGTKQELEDIPVEDRTKALAGTPIDDPTKAAGGQEHPNPTGIGGNTTPENGYVGDRRFSPGGVVGDRKVPTGGAHTHYALDVKRDGKALLRLVVLDTSLRSLAASNANQNPVEEQLGWLQDALKRPEGQRAVVLTNTPTYSYGPGAGGDTVTEGTVLESILMQNKVDLVVDGRLGWNALYYALAPGVHWPCPGDSYKATPPKGVPSCGPAASSEADKAAADAQKSITEITGGTSTPGPLPFLVSASAGGRFGPDGDADGNASNGFWRGYSIVHLDPDSGQIQIEQRPVFDWIGIRPASSRDATHVLRPGQKTRLEGFGREMLGIDTSVRYDEITSPAITHCYDLVYADPEKPWLPLEAEDASDEQLAGQGEGCANRGPASSQLASAQSDSSSAGQCDPYVCVPTSVGTVNSQSGEVRAGSGEQERTFAMVILSVNEKVATYPLTFEPRPSFTPPRIPPPPPQPPPAPPAPPANPPVGTVGNLSLPTPPALPSLPLGAELVPPAPPIPPPPPGSANVAPLNLFLSTPGINIAPQSTVVPPPAPPIQPAPPGGARKEARQRQAAAQKSGSEAGEGAEETQGSGGDMAQGLPTGDSAMTRHQHEFTAYSPQPQASAWTRNLQWGGGMTLMALVLAFGWITVRPTPRRGQPELPAPAWSRTRAGRDRPS